MDSQDAPLPPDGLPPDTPSPDAPPPGSAADADAPTPPAQRGLSARDRRVLAFETRRWRHAGAKEQAIREEFGISATRYYQILNALLDRPEALRCHPTLVNRLRRLRDARQEARTSRTPPTP